MFSLTKSKEFDEVQRQDADVNRRHYGEDVKFYLITNILSFIWYRFGRRSGLFFGQSNFFLIDFDVF